MFFHSNIKMLRNRRGRKQEEVAFSLGISRSTLNNYENSAAQPDLNRLIEMSYYYKICIDTLVKVDLTKVSESQLSEIERGFDPYVLGSGLRVLATTIDTSNKETIELVNEKARAGYQSGYADQEYISSLPTFQLPFLSQERKYRSFQISGDSMLPIPEGSYIIGEYVQNWESIKDGQAYIILTLQDGIVFKIVYNRIKAAKTLLLKSLNPVYEPFELLVKEIKEVWKFTHYISSQVPDAWLPAEHLASVVMKIHENVEEIKGYVKGSKTRKSKTQ